MKKEKTKLELSNVHRWRLTGFLQRPGTVGTYARYLARELFEDIQFTSQEIKDGGIEETQDPANPGQVRFTWTSQQPKTVLLDEDERLALLEILLTKPQEWLLGAGDDVIRWLVRDREEMKQLIAKYKPEEIITTDSGEEKVVEVNGDIN